MPNQFSKFLDFILLSLGLLVARTGAFAQGNLMPAGFEALHLGMSWNAVIAARPNAEILDLLPAPGKSLKPNLNEPKEGLMENLDSSTRILRRALYVFENGTLLGATFSGDASGDGNVRQKFLEEVATRHGPPEKVALIPGQPNQAVATWSSNQQLINATFPVRGDIVNGTSVTWQILDRVLAEKIGAMGTVSNTTPPTEQERATIELVSQEFRKLSPSKNSAPPAHELMATAKKPETASPFRSQRWIWGFAIVGIITLAITLNISRQK